MISMEDTRAFSQEILQQKLHCRLYGCEEDFSRHRDSQIEASKPTESAISLDGGASSVSIDYSQSSPVTGGKRKVSICTSKKEKGVSSTTMTGP